jgi:hypothetical protein
MDDRRAKLIAGATVLGLGALGGVAMGTNHGIPPSPQVAGAPRSIVTSASTTAAAQPVAATTSTRPPIVTRASGGAAPLEIDD